MKFSEVVSIISSRLGNRPDLRSEIEAEAEYVKEFLMERDPSIRPWFLLEESTSLAVTSGVNTVSLPTDFIAFYEDGGLFNASGLEIEQATLTDIKQQLYREDGTTVDGTTPTAFALRGTTLHLYPMPSADTTISLNYYKKSATLANSPNDNPWLVHAADWLLNATGVRVAANQQHVDAVKVFSAEEIRARSRVIGENEERRATE